VSSTSIGDSQAKYVRTLRIRNSYVLEDSVLFQELEERVKPMLETGKSGEIMRIALDLDGVLADLHSVLLKKFSEVANRQITIDMITSWHAADKFKPGLSFTYYSVWEDYEPEQIKPCEPDIGSLVEQIRKTAPVDVVSGHGESSRQNIQRWLAIHRVRYENLVLIGERIGKRSSKLSLTRDYNVFIDDNPALAEKAPSTILVLLYSQPWNQLIQRSPADDSVVRIRSLAEVPEHVRSRGLRSTSFNA